MPAHSHGGAVATPHAPNAALLIDFDNVTMGIRSDLQTELKNLLSSDIVKGKVSVQRAYADWRRYPQYIVPLSESSIDLIFAPAYGSSKKNATDIRLAIDALELVFTRPEIGTFILLSGDSDFSSLVIKLKEYGKYVIGVGIRESSSDLLVQNCDEYYSYNALAGLVRFGEEESVRWDPWELVTEAVSRMKRNGDVMRADRLKQVMQQIDTEFDEKNLGMSKVSRFVSEAAQRGLLSLKKLDNGQIEIDQSAARPAAAAADAPAAAGAEPARAEKGRSRSRGGRGRGREKERKADAGTDADAPARAETDIGERLDVAAAAHPAAQAEVSPPATA
ncbi:MAG: NYN domain-containing protein, partial [Gemmatimonadaceae bacterium]